RSIEFLLAEGRLVPKGKKYPTVWVPGRSARIAPNPDGPRRPRPQMTGVEGELRRYRTQEARKRRWKPYQVFDDKTMQAIIGANPRTLAELEAVPGIGPKRLDAFGPRILDILAHQP